MTIELKPQEERLLRFIVNYKRASGGNSPTHRAICQGLPLASTSVSNYWVQKLVEKGILEIREHKIHVKGGTWVAPSNLPLGTL